MNNYNDQALRGLTDIDVTHAYPNHVVTVPQSAAVIIDDSPKGRSMSFRGFAMILSLIASLSTIGVVLYNFFSSSPDYIKTGTTSIDVSRCDPLTIAIAAAIFGCGFIFTLATAGHITQRKSIFPPAFWLFIIGNALIIASAVIFDCAVHERQVFSFEPVDESVDDGVAPEDLINQNVCIRAHASSTNYDINGYCGKAIDRGTTADKFIVKAYWWYWFSETRREIDRSELDVVEKRHVLWGFNFLHSSAEMEYRHKLELYYNSTRDGSSFFTQEYRRRMMEEAHTRTQVTLKQVQAAAANLAAEEDLNGARFLYHISLDKNVVAATNVQTAIEEVTHEEVSFSSAKNFRGNNMIGKEVVLKGLTGDLSQYNGSKFYITKYQVGTGKAPLMLTVKKSRSMFDFFSGSVVLTVNENEVTFVELEKAKQKLSKAEQVAQEAASKVIEAKKEFKRAIKRTAKAVLVYKQKLAKSF